MTTEPNRLSVPEIRNYRAAVIDRRYVVTYEQRPPGAVAWELVRTERAARPEDAPAAPAKRAG